MELSEKMTETIIPIVVGAVVGYIASMLVYLVLFREIRFDFVVFNIIMALFGGVVVVRSNENDLNWKKSLFLIFATLVIWAGVEGELGRFLISTYGWFYGLWWIIFFNVCVLIVISHFDSIKALLKRGVQKIKPITFYFD